MFVSTVDQNVSFVDIVKSIFRHGNVSVTVCHSTSQNRRKPLTASSIPVHNNAV